MSERIELNSESVMREYRHKVHWPLIESCLEDNGEDSFRIIWKRLEIHDPPKASYAFGIALRSHYESLTTSWALGDDEAFSAAMPDLKPESPFVRAAAKAVDPVTRIIGVSPKRLAAAFLPKLGYQVIGSADFLEAEVPSVNGVFTARSLAKMYAALGSDPGLDDVQLWSPERRGIAAAVQNTRRDRVVPIKPRWRLGYHGPFPKKSASDEAFGFYGAHGSGAYADPQRNLAVGLVVQEAKGTPLMKLAPMIGEAVDAGAL